MKLITVRHCERDLSDPGFTTPLTIAGVAQSQVLAQKIKAEYSDVTKIYCSPFLRTVQTAIPIIRHLELSGDQIFLDSRLYEYLSPPQYFRTTPPIGDGPNDQHTANFNWSFKLQIPALETCVAFQERIRDFMNEVSTSPNDTDTVLVITHASACHYIHKFITGKQPDAPIEMGETNEYNISDPKYHKFYCH